MIKDITIGQFFPGKSVFHRMDPRVKLILTVAFIVTIFICRNFYSMAFITLSVIGVMLFTKVPAKLYFRSLKPILPLILITAVLNIFYIGGEDVLFEWSFIKITEQGLSTAVLMAVRIICLIVVSSVLTYTTSPTDLTDAIERVLSPLKIFKLDIHSLAMMMTIALRFIPTLIEETDKITSAQKARGADFENGGFMQKIKSLIPIIIPLFVSSFRRAYELAYAMDCRCYMGGEGRTKMKILKMSAMDFIAIFVLLIILATVIFLNISL